MIGLLGSLVGTTESIARPLNQGTCNLHPRTASPRLSGMRGLLLVIAAGAVALLFRSQFSPHVGEKMSQLADFDDTSALNCHA